MNTNSNTQVFVNQLREQIKSAPSGIDISALENALKTIEQPVQTGAKIWFLLDRSGSMGRLTNDVINGFNKFLSEQTEKDDEALMSVILFDGHDPFEVIEADTPIRDIEPLDQNRYFARGNTPLYDAIGTLIKQADRRIRRRKHENLPEEDQLVIIFTDGLENASRRYFRNEVFGMVNDRMEQDWTFVFMGANQDSYAEGGNIGFKSGSIQNYDPSPASISEAFGSLSRASGEFRGKGSQERRSSKEDFFSGVKEAEMLARRQKRENRDPSNG